MKYFLVALAVLVSITAVAQKTSYSVGLIGFYNLENLFDTIDDPATNDEEFLPLGSKRYTGEVYKDKLKKLSDVLSIVGTDISPDGLSLIGNSEIENEAVLRDLVNQPSLKARNYQIVHYDSPDLRGVDVGLIYNPKYFKPINSQSLYVKLPATDSTEVRKTRDVLYVYGKYVGEDLFVFVNHWPSRRGGEEASRPGRIAAAQVCRDKIDSIIAVNPDAKIIVMGDLNDDPVNYSVTKVLKAETERKRVDRGELYNPWAVPYKQGMGTGAFNDTWNLFDQIIISSGFLDKEKGGFFYHEAKIFSKPWMIETQGQYKGYPKRSYSYDVYQGGYSDHLPTYIVLYKKAVN